MCFSIFNNTTVRRVFPFLLLGFLVISPGLYSSDLPTRERVRTVMETITAFDFRESDRQIDMMTQEMPESFYPDFLESYKVFYGHLLRPQDKERTEKFSKTLERMIEKARLQKTGDLSDALLVESCGYLLLALLHLEQGHNLSSLVYMQKGITIAQELRSKGETPDTLLILGWGNYYSKPGSDLFLGQLQAAAAEGFFFQDLSSFMMGKFLQQKNEKPEIAAEVFSILYKKYPSNSIFSFYYAKSLQHLGRARESLEIYKETLKRIDYYPLPEELICRIHFARGQLFETDLKVYHAAAAEYEKALEYIDPEIEGTMPFLPLCHLHLGRVYIRMDKIQNALYHLSLVKPEDNRRAYRNARAIIKGLVP